MRSLTRGMSLIEVVTSISVLGIGVVALADLHTTAERTDKRTNARDVATQIAIQRIEQLAVQPISRLPDCPGSTSCRSRRAFGGARSSSGTFNCTQVVDEAGFSDGTDSDPQGRYRIDTAVNVPQAASQQEGAMVITVSVCWLDQRQTVQEVQIERLVVPGL